MAKVWLDEAVSIAQNDGFSARELQRVRSLVGTIARPFWPHGENTVDDPRIASASVADDMLSLRLDDGRIVSVPIAYYWRLAEATETQRQHFEILPNRRGIHWPDIDEDISARGVLTGTPAKRQDSGRRGPSSTPRSASASPPARCARRSRAWRMRGCASASRRAATERCRRRTWRGWWRRYGGRARRSQPE